MASNLFWTLRYSTPPTLSTLQEKRSLEYFTCSFLFGASPRIGAMRPETWASLTSHPPSPQPLVCIN